MSNIIIQNRKNTPRVKKKKLKTKERSEKKTKYKKEELNQTISQRHFVYIFKSVYDEQHFAIISK